MIPVVNVSLSPNGLPIAITCCPTCREEKFTIGMGHGYVSKKHLTEGFEIFIIQCPSKIGHGKEKGNKD